MLATKTRPRTSDSLPRCAAVAILSLFLLCSAESWASDTNEFYRLPIYSTGGTPVKLVTADFNHDGATDLAFIGAAFDRGDATGIGFNYVGSLVIFYNQGGDHVALASSISKPKANQAVTFTARVTTSYGETGTPTGKVTFMDGTHTLGSAYLDVGAAKITASFTAGTHQILAEYGGDTTFNPNHSSTLTLAFGP